MFGFLKRKNVDPHAELKRVLGDYDLPSFPSVVLQVMKELRSENASARSVAAVLQGDPGITVRLLKLVNSAAFGSARQTESVSQAVAILGMSQVESLVLAIGVQSVLPPSSHPGFEARRFWRAAARRAGTAQAFAARLHPTSRSQSFTASLLQDMAVPLLSNSKPMRYGELLQEWHAGGGPLDELEKSELGCHHGEVASWLCHEWELPEPLAEAIGGHHGDPDLNCPPAVRLVGRLGETEQNEGLDALVADAKDHGLAEDEAVQIAADGAEAGEELAKLFT